MNTTQSTETMEPRFDVGDSVRLTPEARKNYEIETGGPRTVTHVATAQMNAERFFAEGKPDGFHPGFDPASGSALYDVHNAPVSFYGYELEPAQNRDPEPWNRAPETVLSLPSNHFDLREVLELLPLRLDARAVDTAIPAAVAEKLRTYGAPGTRPDLETVWSYDRDTPERTARFFGAVPLTEAAADAVRQFNLRHGTRYRIPRTVARIDPWREWRDRLGAERARARLDAFRERLDGARS
jgi:hypothetical protein